MKHRPEMTPDTAPDAVRVFFSHRSPQLLLLVTVVCSGARLALGNWSLWDAVVVATVFALWPLLEWLIHVYMLHYRPVTVFGHKVDFRLPQTHREHHADPWRLDRVFIPTHVFPLVLPLLLALTWLLAPSAELGLSFLAIYFLFALNYEWCHYLAHVRWNPPLRYYQRRVRSHRAHHFRNENLWWGVSRGEADWLLRTAPAIQDVASTGTTKSLLPSP